MRPSETTASPGLPAETILDPRVLRLPSVCSVTACIALGIFTGNCLPLAPAAALALCLIWLTAAAVSRNSGSLRTFAILILIACLAAARYQTTRMTSEFQLRDLTSTGATTRTTGVVSTIASLHLKPDSANHDGTPKQQTRFQVQLRQAEIGHLPTGQPARVSLHETTMVYVEGDVRDRIWPGAEVRLLGRVSWPEPPANPGEFDYAGWLQQQGVSSMLFVSTPGAVSTTSAPSRYAPGRLMSVLRGLAWQAIAENVSEDVRGVALAMLLGERHQLPMETEQEFIASGTIHLLAISGLHMGILCIFLLRSFRLLEISRRCSLIATLLISLIYAFMTGMQPSVTRAVLFFAIFVCGQLLARPQRSAGLISTTAGVMLLWQPSILFSSGAWLSFLSVSALAWVGTPSRGSQRKDPAPMNASDRAGLLLRQAAAWIWTRYRQMLGILAVTTPLIAAVFHVVSPIGMLINLLLIPLTMITLCVGFATLGIGVVVPAVASAPAAVFSWLLTLLVGSVSYVAGLTPGHMYVPDFPPWFLPSYYVMLALALSLRAGWGRRLAVLGLLTSVLVTQLMPSQHPPAGMRCTILQVGHGSATIVEFNDGRVIVVDAGAMRAGSRAADVVCNCLWARGHDRINEVIISHADADHYNALESILDRFPVGRVVLSERFSKSTAPGPARLLRALTLRRIPILIGRNGWEFNTTTVRGRLLQADVPEDATDNEASLVVSMEYADRRILFPGDLEGRGLRQLHNSLTPHQVVVSPHHGAQSANTRMFARATAPKTLIVSAGSTDAVTWLSDVYRSVDHCFFTADSGAITVEFQPDGTIRTTEFRPFFLSPDR